MSDVQNFIDIPLATQTFKSRLQQSVHTALQFLNDQKWTSLVFLIVYIALLYWDSRYAIHSPEGTAPEWTANWPTILHPIREEFVHYSKATWRATLAGLVTLLFWGNALLFIADRSEAFHNDSVVGLVRYLLRSLGIFLLLALPVALGLALIFLPGLFIGATMLASATLAVFQHQSIFRAIASGYRLNTQSLPNQRRLFGFSRSFIHITGCYALSITTTLLFSLLMIYVFYQLPAPLSFVKIAATNLLSSFLNLLFSLFILHLHAERINLLPSSEPAVSTIK